jgi:hypothetical protein
MNARLINLYQIPADWQVILEKIVENDGEMTDDIVVQIYALINHGKSKIEDAVLAKRNLEFISEQAMAQARLFQKEYERCKAIAETWENAANKIGQAMIPVLEITGKVQTAAGTAFLRKTPSYTFALKEGAQFFDLPAEAWRQRDPELNRQVLREMAQANRLPEQIAVSKSETTSVCLKRPTPSKTAETIETTNTTKGAAA